MVKLVTVGTELCPVMYTPSPPPTSLFTSSPVWIDLPCLALHVYTCAFLSLRLPPLNLSSGLSLVLWLKVLQSWNWELKRKKSKARCPSRNSLIKSKEIERLDFVWQDSKYWLWVKGNYSNGENASSQSLVLAWNGLCLALRAWGSVKARDLKVLCCITGIRL